MSHEKCCHRHHIKCETTCDCCHDHDVKDKTSYAPSCVPHIHYIETCTEKSDGHHHTICIPTSEAIPTCGGGHYHTFQGPTENCECHMHFIDGCTDEVNY